MGQTRWSHQAGVIMTMTALVMVKVTKEGRKMLDLPSGTSSRPLSVAMIAVLVDGILDHKRGLRPRKMMRIEGGVACQTNDFQ